MTKDQLLKFIRIRNESGFGSNLQFELDAGEAGFSVKDLGPGDWVEIGGPFDKAFQWQTPFGALQEYHGQLALLETEGRRIPPGVAGK